MTGEAAQLPLYRSHKIVQAAKIVGILFGARKNTLELEGGLSVDFGPLVYGRIALAAGDQPLIGGYYVVYGDGYESWSPAKVFEEGNTLINPALAEVKRCTALALDQIRSMQHSNGSAFARNCAVAITNIEQAVLWLEKPTT